MNTTVLQDAILYIDNQSLKDEPIDFSLYPEDVMIQALQECKTHPSVLMKKLGDWVEKYIIPTDSQSIEEFDNMEK